MEEAVDNLEKQMQRADEKLDGLAVKVVHVEKEILTEQGAEVEVNNLLRSVTDVKNEYQNLRRDILEVQDLQKQLSSSLQTQLQLLQIKSSLLKEKIVPQKSLGVSKIFATDHSPGKTFQESKNGNNAPVERGFIAIFSAAVAYSLFSIISAKGDFTDFIVNSYKPSPTKAYYNGKNHARFVIYLYGDVVSTGK